MFNDIPNCVLDQMHRLEQIDAKDRCDGTPRLQRLRQIPPETGKFLALLAAGVPPGQWLEIGTSAGYSALWISLACRLRGQTLTTFEVLPEKFGLAQETFRLAGVDDCIVLVSGDVRTHAHGFGEITFCFLDAEKESYPDCYEAVIPNLAPGGLLVADNAISHRNELPVFLNHALSDTRVDALVIPIGKGELVCRKL